MTNPVYLDDERNSGIRKSQVIKKAGALAVGGALLGGVSGLSGKMGLSFFESNIGHAAGPFLTFAKVGAIAACISFIPTIGINLAIDNIYSLEERPNLKEFLKDTANFAIQIGAIAAAAALLSTPIGPTVICMLVIPALFYFVKSICNIINAVNAEETPLPSASNRY
ncbi:MAG: hypothetical protein H0U75_09715 [Legionella sp.]|nr:hypothetical protein [Legionella sp.]